MSQLGRTISQIRESGNQKSKVVFEEKFPIGIKTPVEKGFKEKESLFKMHFDPISQIKDNLRNLIMTQKGERLGFPDFGTNIIQVYNNPTLTEDEVSDIIVSQINETVLKYMPALRLNNFYSTKIDDAKGPNLAGQKFSNLTNTVSLGQYNIEEVDKINKNTETTYKIDIDFSVSSLNSGNQKITLYIKSNR